MKNFWIITEERPKLNVLEQIIKKFSGDYDFDLSISNMVIHPIMKDGLFTFVYEVIGVNCKNVNKIFIKIASGNSSFVDFLIFYQEEEPDPSKSIPIYAIEETKTDDSESRNTGVYQRCSKFVFVDFYYPKIKKIMLYNLQVSQKEKPTDTSIFGTRMLLTIGVEIIGKKLDYKIMKPFSSLNELVKAKNSMRLPPKGNVPVRIEKLSDKITVSGTLFKKNSLSHDPNIGAITIIALCIRKWEKNKDIVVIKHGLSQKHVGRTNKFIQIANKLNIKLDKLNVPSSIIYENYWHYELTQEKLASIFTHIVVESFTKGKSIYENHGGSERGYFFDKNRKTITIPKYQEGKRNKYKNGDKTSIIYIPDLVIFDPIRNEILNIEGKKYSTRLDGIKELKNYGYFERRFIIPNYNPKKIIRMVTVFGSKLSKIKEKQIGLMLNENGLIVLNTITPEIIKEAVSKLLKG
jgi:hypothetical protein